MTIFDELIRADAGRVHFAFVEKRGVSPLDVAQMTPDQTLSKFRSMQNGGCSPEYFAHETEWERAQDALLATTALASEPWVTSVLLVGHSEGSQVVAGVLKRDQGHRIAAAAMLAGAGPTQFFSGTETRAELVAKFNLMLSIRNSADDTMFDGHAARRWKTYALDRTTLSDLSSSRVPLFVAEGTREESIHAVDLFVLESLRVQPTRPLRYFIAQDADHGFHTARGVDKLPVVFEEFLRWGLDSSHPTGVLIDR